MTGLSQGFLRSPLAVKQWILELRRKLCTPSKPFGLSLSVPRAVLPSAHFLARHEHHQVFLRLLLELEYLYSSSSCSSMILPKSLSEKDWINYVRINGTIERCCFLAELAQNKAKLASKQALLQEVKENLFRDSNSTVFNTLFYFDRNTFRRIIYEVYGSRLLAAWRCEQSQPPILIDCSYLQMVNEDTRRILTKHMKDLILDNSVQRTPFPITFVNYRCRSNIAQRITDSWLSKRCLQKYRSDVDAEHKNENEDIEEAAEEHSHNSDEPQKEFNGSDAPFAPVITSLGVRECLANLQPEEIAYINPKAVTHLPLPMKRYKAFVLCATLEQNLQTSSHKAAFANQIKSYSFPIDKYLNLGNSAKMMPLRLTAAIIRDLYAMDDKDWEWAFQKHIPYFQLLVKKTYEDHSGDNNNLAVLEDWITRSVKLGKRKRIYVHKYSREQRREARARSSSSEHL